MGVAGLWNVLRPAGKTRSLTELSVSEGFEANPEKLRGYRIGIDASIWFFHAEYGREGENPVLRTLFFRCATLMRSPFLPLFVFDGPLRPDFKRGKKINKTGNKLIPGMKSIVEAFGFEWRTAPGEAEAELAYLNRIGVIDGILSDDVDNFLFGASVVIRNPSNNLSGNKANPVLNAAGKDDKNHTRIYRLVDIMAHPDVGLTRGGMILIGLMKGGDYHPGGLARCGPVIAHGLAQCGFGDTLFEAAKNLNREELSAFLVQWRHELRQELSTNSQGRIGKKQPALAKMIPESFPDHDILLSYVNPITSESMGKGDYYKTLTWGKEPDPGKLAAICELSFEWGYKEAIIKRFRTVIWHSVVLRILRRAVLDMDEKARHPPSLLMTPRKKSVTRSNPVGTPSKMITKHFSSLMLERLPGSADSEEDDDDEERLIIKIHSSRNHVSTDEMLEYRLEIAPAQLVRIAESGIKGLRAPEGPDEWVDDVDDDDGEGKKGLKSPDPKSHMRVWMPACMVRLAEPGLVAEYESTQAKKLKKKAVKGRSKTGNEIKVAPFPGSLEDSTSGDELPIVQSKPAREAVAKAKLTLEPGVTLPQALSPDSIVVQGSKPERVVRDLTKKNSTKPNILSDSHLDIKSFFGTTKPSRSVAKTISSPLTTVRSPPDEPHPLKLPQSLSSASSSRIGGKSRAVPGQRNFDADSVKDSLATTSTSTLPSHAAFDNDDDLFLSDESTSEATSLRSGRSNEQRHKKHLPPSDPDPLSSPAKISLQKIPESHLHRLLLDAGGPNENEEKESRSKKETLPLHTSMHSSRVIEISSDSDDGDPSLPITFPLAAARARTNPNPRSKPTRHELVHPAKPKSNVTGDIIDLT